MGYGSAVKVAAPRSCLDRSVRPVTGRKVFLWFLGAFLVVLGANVTMVTLAAASFPGLVVKNSYVASQQFNATRAAHAAQAIRQWRVGFDHPAGKLRLTIHDAAGQPVEAQDLHLNIRRAVGVAQLDWPLTAQGGGVYQAEAGLAPGLWIVALRGIGPDGQSFDAQYRLNFVDGHGRDAR